MTPSERKSILKTYLSRKPAAGSFWASAYSLAVLMVLFMLYQDDVGGLAKWMTATPDQVFAHGQYWRALTTLGVHADLEHFLANAGFFSGLAFLLSAYFGVWAFPVLSLAGGTLANLIALKTYEPTDVLLGASGVVYFMAAFWLSQYAGIERRLSLPRRLINSAAFTLVLLMPATFEPRVSYRTHAIGYVLGWVLGGLYYWTHRKMYREAEVIAPPEVQENPSDTWSQEEMFG
jgi:rhomboid protease GluP